MRLDHIGIAVENLAEAESLFDRLLGRSPYKQETVAGQHVTTSFYEAGAAGSKLELVVPTTAESPLTKYLAKRGPGIHHLAFEVDDIRAEMERLRQAGFELLQDRPTRGADDKWVCFLHPKSTGGVLVEICQSDDNPTGGAAADAGYWSGRYQTGQTGWDTGHVAPPIKAYLDQLPDKDIAILIPGAGNGHEAEYAHRQGFGNVTVLDIAPEPLANLSERVPDFPRQHLVRGDFFGHEGRYDLILEHTFFCSFPPSPKNRGAYAAKIAKLLNPGGKLVGLFFDFPLDAESGKRPFGGSREEYLGYFEPHFKVRTLAPAHNSIRPRAGRELFAILEKPRV